MPLASALPLRLSDILAEFSAPAGTGLASLLKGGTLVPVDVVGGDIPTELPIAVSDFLGAISPAAARITAIDALVGSVSSVSFAGATGEATLSHITAQGDETITKTASMRVSFIVDHATTPKIRIAPRATNAAAGLFRSPLTSYSVPSFDGGVISLSDTGVATADTTGDRRGSWSASGPVAGVGLSEPARIAGATFLTDAAVDGTVFTANFAMSHNVKAYIGGHLNFGDIYSHNCIGGVARFGLSLLFLNPAGDTIVQELPIDITLRANGLLRAIARDFEPPP